MNKTIFFGFLGLKKHNGLKELPIFISCLTFLTGTVSTCILPVVEGDVNDQPDMQMAVHFPDGPTLTHKGNHFVLRALYCMLARLEMGWP